MEIATPDLPTLPKRERISASSQIAAGAAIFSHGKQKKINDFY